METIGYFLAGIQTVLEPGNLMLAFAGCLLGTIIGVLPGIGPAGAIAILIPLTAGVGPAGSIIMIAAIYYGAMYGGTITSVLINTPGEAASAVTCLDGYQMARRGRAGVALSVAAIGSFIGGTFSTFCLVFLALPLAGLALSFGPPEVFALLVLGLTLVTGLAGKSFVRAMIAAVLGMLLSQIGIDPVMGAPRFTFGQIELMDGFGLVPVVMGLFGIGEIFASLEDSVRREKLPPLNRLWPSRTDMKNSGWPIARGSVIGFVLGLIPGIGTVVPTFLSYSVERRASRNPDAFGNGAIEGVAGPESANNAAASAALIPLFTLGIPATAVTALMMGAFMMQGLTPGPLLFSQNPEVVWAVIASLLIGNLILLVLNLPFIPLWVMILRVPRAMLTTAILLFCVVGAYSLGNSVFDVGVMLAFGVIGWLLGKIDVPLAPLVLTIVLTPILEATLRQSLEMSRGQFSIFFNHPLSAGMLTLAIASVAYSALRGLLPGKALA